MMVRFQSLICGSKKIIDTIKNTYDFKKNCTLVMASFLSEEV